MNESASGRRDLQRPPAFKTILITGLFAGGLDILAAFVHTIYIQSRTTTVQKILQYIASAVINKEAAYTGGWTTAMLGLALHFVIAFCFAAGFYLCYPVVPFLRKQKIIAGLLYGLFAWAVMNLGVMQIVKPYSVSWQNSWPAALILMLFIGLPISLITGHFFEKSWGPDVGSQAK